MRCSLRSEPMRVLVMGSDAFPRSDARGITIPPATRKAGKHFHPHGRTRRQLNSRSSHSRLSSTQGCANGPPEMGTTGPGQSANPARDDHVVAGLIRRQGLPDSLPCRRVNAAHFDVDGACGNRDTLVLDRGGLKHGFPLTALAVKRWRALPPSNRSIVAVARAPADMLRRGMSWTDAGRLFGLGHRQTPQLLLDLGVSEAQEGEHVLASPEADLGWGAGKPRSHTRP